MSWRVGRKVGRTIYLQAGEKPSDDDRLIGVMDTPELAQIVVAAVNSLQKGPVLRRPSHREAMEDGPVPPGERPSELP